MARNAVEVDHVSKRYLIGEGHGRSSLRDAAARLPRVGRRRSEELWALRDVSLEIPEGGAVGVVGRNGAGKSTLFKVLTRITEPTEGVSRTRGRVAGLLEVGTGFHPELTGRENVYLNGAILGMSRQQIQRRFDEIIEFAGVERFIDTPVKRYSSGMYLRLAFAVAAHLEPDILVIDEVLAVGDAEFQRKCLGRMIDAEREGRTLVFVSHDLDAIAHLCPRSIWLDRGAVVADGGTREVIDAYLASAARAGVGWAGPVTAGPVTVHELSVQDEAGRPIDVLRRGDTFHIGVRYSLEAAVPDLDLAIYLVNQKGVRVLDEMSSDTCQDRPNGPGHHVARVTVPPVLNVGTYTIGLWVGSSYDNFLDEPVAANLAIEGSAKDRPDRVVELRLPWTFRSVRNGGST